MRTNIFLIGFMGVGKTTIGRLLAEKANMEFYDLDRMIEEATGLTINEIFRKRGESWFRQVENRVLSENACGFDKVFATGGGVVLNPENRKRMNSCGIVVALTASVDTLWDRLKDKTDRPLLFSRKPKETLNQLYNQREELYKEARFIVKVDGKSADELAEEILRLVNDDNRIAD